MKTVKLARISAIITAVMLFLQFGTWLVNDLLWRLLQISVPFDLSDYWPLQIALVATALVSLIARKKDTLTEKPSAFSVIMPILTMVITAAWVVVVFVINLIKTIITARMNHLIEIQAATIGELMSTQSYLGYFIGICNFLFALCFLALFAIAFFKAKDRGYAIKAEFAKIATAAIVMIVSFFNAVIFIANSILARTSGPEVLSKMHTAASSVSLIVTLMATLALAVVALLLGLISKKEKESV